MATTGIVLADLDEVRRNWGWVLALGIALFVLGLIATSAAFVTTFATIIFFGFLLLIAGAFEISNAFRHGKYGGFWMHLLTGILDIVCGSMLLAFPGAGAAALTFILAIFFLVGGAFRLASSLIMQLPNGGWAALSGVIDVLLGMLLLGSWPVSALWFLGMVVGIGLLFRGAWWVAFALAVHRPAAVPNP